MNRWMFGTMDNGWMNGQIFTWKDGWTDGWMIKCLDSWIGDYIDGWMDG